MQPIKVLIVDDSKVVRQILAEIIGRDPQLTLVGEAQDPYQARELIKQLNPDVLTLDIEMPRMDGLTFLKNLMRLRPMPVVMLSTLTTKGADVTLDALELGAVDFIPKPKLALLMESQRGFQEQLLTKIKYAARAKTRAYRPGQRQEVVPLSSPAPGGATRQTIIALGASTGGTEALRDVLESFPGDAPAVVVTQHIPAAFSQRFAQRLDKHCQMHVHQASQDQRILPGNIYIAPGDRHLRVIAKGGLWYCHLEDGEPVNRHKPSVDVLFHSLCELQGITVKAALLTGMGDDGAKGMVALKQQGALTVAQDEATSLVWGMPGKAVALNGHCQEAPLQDIAKHLLD